MSTLASIMAELKAKGTEKTRKVYERHGMKTKEMFGVSIADLKIIAKSIKGQQVLACALYNTGNVDAMYLAGIVADGSQMTVEQLNAWAAGAANLPMVAEHTVPWVAIEHPNASDLAMKWIKSKEEHIASSGWCTYSGLVATQPDETLNLTEVETLLNIAIKESNSAKDRVRYAMNGFVIAVGSYVKPLSQQAKAAARHIGTVSVDMGDTACKVPLALAAIEKIEAEGKVGRKRKTMRC